MSFSQSKPACIDSYVISYELLTQRKSKQQRYR